MAIIIPHALHAMYAQGSTIVRPTPQNQAAKTYIPFRQEPAASHHAAPAVKIMPLTAKNLAQHNNNQLSPSPTSAFTSLSKKATSSKSSPSTYSADFFEPTIPLTYDQLDAAGDLATPSISSNSSRTASPTSSNSSRVQGGVEPYNMPHTTINADGYKWPSSPSSRANSRQASDRTIMGRNTQDDDLNTVDLSSETESIHQQHNNTPTGLMFNFNASNAAAQAGQALAAIPGQIYNAGKYVYNNLPTQQTLSHALSYTGKAVQAIPRNFYNTPGYVAKNLLYHPDGKIIFGDTYSVNSAGKSLYTMAANTQNSIKKALTPSQTRVEAQRKTQTLGEPDKESINDPMKNPDISGSGWPQRGDLDKNKYAQVGYDADEPTRNVDLPVIRNQKSLSTRSFWGDDMDENSVDYDQFVGEGNAQESSI